MTLGMRVLVLVVTVVGVLCSGMPGAAAQTSGLVYTEDTVFSVLEDRVLVETTAVMTNTTTERRSGNTIYYSYFDRFQHVVPRGATELTVTSRGRTLSSSLDSLDDDFDMAVVDLPSQLRSGQSRTLELSYVLPTGSIRGEGVFFSNPAFHSFPVWSFSDPGTGSLVLRVPENAELGQFGGVLRPAGQEDGFVLWEPRDFEQPDDVFAFVTITIDEALIEDSFSVSDQDIVLRTWPGDDVWLTFARDTIETGLPALEEMIGLPVPDQDSLEVTESVTPYFYGYGGWYDPAETTIEVGNELEDTVMLHELSHAWFNDALFTERWVNEGLAEEFTWQTQSTLGWPTEAPPEQPRLTDRGAVALVDWGNGLGANLGDEDLRASEEYGYAASWYVVRELVGIVGIEGMRSIIASADGDLVSYGGDDPVETTSARNDWRRLLDLSSEAVDSESEAAIDRLFVDYIVSADDASELDERREARDAYAEFLNLEPGWRVPDELRHLLTTWDFEEATEIMEEAQSVLLRYSEVQRELADRQLNGSDAAQRAYEAEEPAFQRAMDLLAVQSSLLPEVDALRETFARPLTTNQQWGFGDADLAPLVAHGERAFELDQYLEISAAQRDLDALLVAAELRGSERIFWAKVGVASVAGALLVAAWGIRRRRRSTSAASDIDIGRDDVVLSV